MDADTWTFRQELRDLQILARGVGRLYDVGFWTVSVPKSVASSRGGAQTFQEE